MINPILEMKKLRLRDMKEVCSKDCEVTGKRVVGRGKLGLKEENLKVQMKAVDFVLTSEAFDYLIFFFFFLRIPAITYDCLWHLRA